MSDLNQNTSSVYAVPPASAPLAPPPYATGQPTNAMAIIALVSSIVGWVMLPIFGSAWGIALGYQARKQMAKSGESGAGMATAAIVLGFIQLALVCLTLFAVVLFFVFAVVASNT